MRTQETLDPIAEAPASGSYTSQYTSEPGEEHHLFDDSFENSSHHPRDDLPLGQTDMDYTSAFDINVDDIFAMYGMGLGMVDGGILSPQPYALGPHTVQGPHQEVYWGNDDVTLF